MKKLLLTAGLLSWAPLAAYAQPACPTNAPNSAACFPIAVSPQATDIVLGVQATGPQRSNQTVKFSLSQLATQTGSTFTGKRFVGSGPVTFTNSANNSIFFYNSGVNGTITESPSTLYSGLEISSDTASATNILANVFEVLENARAGFSGARTAILGKMNVLGSPTDTGSFYVSVEGDSFASANASGVSTNSPGGSLRGAEFSSLLGTGATFYGTNGALELSAGVQTGASVNNRYIIAIEAASNEAVRGSQFDGGITFNHESNTTPMLQYGIAFGHPGHRWYFASDSTLIGAIPRTIGIGGSNSQPLLANVGLDYSKVDFTTNSVALPGLSIDKIGEISLLNAAIKKTATGVSLDVPNLIVTAGAVNATGSGYNAADLVYEATSGSIFTITVDGSGHITSLVLVVPGSLASAPGAGLALTGGNGTNATVNLTTAANQELDLNPTGGGNTVIGTGSALATNATKGFVQIATMAGNPTGTVGAAGKAAVVLDTTDNELFYSTGGGTWSKPNPPLTQTITASSGTITQQPGATYLSLHLWGAGGPGGSGIACGAATNCSGGSGGGGGADYAYPPVLWSTLGVSSCSVAVGQSQAGGSATRASTTTVTCGSFQYNAPAGGFGSLAQSASNSGGGGGAGGAAPGANGGGTTAGGGSGGNGGGAGGAGAAGNAGFSGGGAGGGGGVNSAAGTGGGSNAWGSTGGASGGGCTSGTTFAGGNGGANAVGAAASGGAIATVGSAGTSPAAGSGAGTGGGGGGSAATTVNAGNGGAGGLPGGGGAGGGDTCNGGSGTVGTGGASGGGMVYAVQY